MKRLIPLVLATLLLSAQPAGALPLVATGQAYDVDEAGACARAKVAAQAAAELEASRRKLGPLQVVSIGECRCVAPTPGGEEFGVAVPQWMCAVNVRYSTQQIQ